MMVRQAAGPVGFVMQLPSMAFLNPEFLSLYQLQGIPGASSLPG